jgi:enoyl-CoA hydratase/carnithine racemase
MYEHILYEVRERIATITLNRPERLNAWTRRMSVEVRHAAADAERDKDVVAIVLTGAGRGFCAGADMQMLGGLVAGQSLGSDPEDDALGALAANAGDPAMGPSYRGEYSYFASIPKPVIAAINGPTAGMAVPIALFCDLRFCSETASFTTSFSRRGLIAEWGVSWILPRLVGPARALDLLLSARKIDAAEALAMGLVNRVVPERDLLPAVRAYAMDLATHCSPTAMAVIKRQIYRHLMEPLDRAEADTAGLMLESFGRTDFAEGVASFLEKRAPRFAPLAPRGKDTA